jgi:MFS family permease
MATPTEAAGNSRWDSGFLSRVPALQHRDFRILWFGMFFSSATMMFQFYAQGWFIVSLTDSAAILGLLGVVRGLAMLIFSLYGGALADRVDRRTLLMVTQGSALCIFAVLAILVSLDWISLWPALGLIFLAASVESMDQPTRQALLPHLVPRRHIANAVSLFTAAQISAYAFFPPFAGIAIEYIGVGGAFGISLFGHAAVIIALLLMRTTAKPHSAGRESLPAAVAGGIRYAAARPNVRWILTYGFLVGALGFPIISTLAPYWMKNELGLDASGWTLMGWAWGIGTLVATVFLSTRKTFDHLNRTVFIGTTGFGLSLVVFGLTRNIPLAAVAWALNGTFFTANMIASASLIQLVVQNAYMGRVTSLRALTSSLNQFSAAPLGAVGDVIGMSRMVPAVAGLLTVLVALPWLSNRSARELDRRHDDDALEPESVGAAPAGAGTGAPPAGSLP